MTAGTVPVSAPLALAAMLAPELDPGYRRRVLKVMDWLPPSADPTSHGRTR